MAQSRLSTAIEDGIVPVSADATVLLIRPPAGYDVSALNRQTMTVQHTFAPDVAAWTRGGVHVSDSFVQADVAIVVVPRSKTLARALIAAASSVAQHVLVDGQKTDGVDSLFKACRAKLGALPSITKSHGRLFWMPGGTAFEDWKDTGPVQMADGYFTQAGVFSDGAVDAGSALLARDLPDKLPARMADLGAGWGYLSAQVLRHEGVATLDLIEAEARALDCARRNISDDRVRFIWADATEHAGEYDGVVMNPPFHQGRSADASLGQAFVGAAARMLTAQGHLWMVANRHLPYEDSLRALFRTVEERPGSGAFKLFHAHRPIR